MKKNIEKIKKIIMKNMENTLIITVSIIALIIGAIAFDFWWSLIIISALNIILFVPPLLKKKPKKNNKSKTTNKNGNIKKIAASKGSSVKKVATDKVTKVKSKVSKLDKNKVFKYLLIAFFSLTIITMLFAIVFFYIIVNNAEFDPEKLYQSEATIIYDKDGKIITKVGGEMREKITTDDMSESLIDAIIATEDSRFFQHNGFDLPRFLKASFGQFLGQDAGGASTLTMQIAKNYLTSTESEGIEGIIRKFTDIYLSIFKIEKNYTKFEILEFYANSNYLGGRDFGGAYGVEQASQLYFGKRAKDLTLPEAALIAGLFQAPNGYDPYLYPDDAEARRKTVLYLMERHGYITNEERKIAEQTTVHDLIVKKEKTSGGEYVGVINTVTAEVMELTGKDPFTVAMEIYTTFDMEKQNHINKVLSGELFTWENEVVDAGISVLDVKTGGIVAVSAGRNKTDLKGYNLATDIERHIGSTAKPLYDYGPGFEYNNWSTYHPFADEPHTYSTGGVIQNWDGKYQGLITLREALRTSRNIPALKAFQDVSNKNIKNFVTSLGLNPELESGIVHESHSLGGYNGESPVSMSGAYAAFANGGYYIKPHSVTKIVFRETNEEVEHKVKKERVMSAETAYMMSSVLLDTAKWVSYDQWYVNGVNYCAKTGTSNYPDAVFREHKLPSNAVNDLWIASYTPDYAIAQWYGYDKIDSKYYNRFGSTQFRRLFQAVAKGIYTENKSFTKPKNVISVEIEKGTKPAMLPSEFTPKDMRITELFKKGTEPTEVSTRYSQLENPTNLQAEQLGSNVNITWNAIETPSAADKTALTNYFKSIFKAEKDQNTYLNERLTYNSKNIGELGYNVYVKSGNDLKLLGFTKNTNYTTTATSGSVTYVVKSAYSIFKNNMSSGVETTITQNSNEPQIESSLIGDSLIELGINDVYLEPNPAIKLQENNKDVKSSDIEITKTITNKTTNNKVNEIDTSATGEFVITYEVNYKNYKQTHTRTIKIK